MQNSTVKAFDGLD